MKQFETIRYLNGELIISSKGIDFLPFDYTVEHVVMRDFERAGIIDRIENVNGRFSCYFTDEGFHECEFARFLRNISIAQISEDGSYIESIRHIHQSIVNKITSLGYLLTAWKSPCESKAVVIRNQYYGCYANGKSLLARAVGYIRKQYCQSHHLDTFHNGISTSTESILIDDIDERFDFAHLFCWITDDMHVDRKAQRPLIINREEAPKIVVTTNHNVRNANQGSYKRRLAFMEVSNWYNQDHAIVDDFGHDLFLDWNSYQWRLFDNFMAECVMWYLKSKEENWGGPGQGIVPPPETF